MRKMPKLKAEEQQEIKRAVEAGEINLESKRIPKTTDPRKPLSEEEVLKLDWVQQLIKEYPDDKQDIITAARLHDSENLIRYALEF